MHTVVNFANLTEVLFAGRSRVPAAAFFFRRAEDGEEASDAFVQTYSPLIANQEANRQSAQGERTESWNLVINESEIRDLSQPDVAKGDALPWKLALWGTHRDLRLINKLSKRFDSFRALERDAGLLLAAEGPPLKDHSVSKGEYKTKGVSGVLGKKVLNTEAVKGYRRIFSFHSSWLLDNERIHLSERGGPKGLKICRGPHVIVSAARIFAVYASDYLIVPARQIGIVSATDDRDFLKALSLFLSSDFAFYH